jgi:hypothetical protein
MANTLATIQEPSLQVLMNQARDVNARMLNCHQVGTIVSFDATKQTASVQIGMLASVGYNEVSYPLLVDCPVFVHSGGDGVITMPIAAGDSCLVLFNDRNLDNWFSYDAPKIPNDQRTHSLSDGLVLVGFRKASNPVASYSITDIELKNDGGVIAIAEKVKIANASASMRTAIDALCTALTGWVDSAGHTPNSTTVTAINAAKTQFDNLFKT